MYKNIKIITTSNLTEKQSSDIDCLLETCRQYDSINCCISLDSSINDINDIPGVFLAYINETLCSVLTLFIPNKYECEIYAYTMPQYRQRHLFSTLLNNAMLLIKNTSIKDIHLISEPNSKSAIKTASSINAVLDYSEYMLSHNISILPSPQHILRINDTIENDITAIQLSRIDTPISLCHLYIHGNYASIFDFQVLEQYRQKGYGKESLLLILEYLYNKGISTIYLHVTGTNHAALNLYLNNGFSIKEQLDYYSSKSNSGPLCQ